MEKIYLIADTHFGEKAILQYENRPFSSVEEMDEEMIRRWNEVVGEEDLVYHLGDFSERGREKSYLERLKGRVILIRGNHDVLTNREYREMGFEEVYDMPVIKDEFWILSHKPIYVNQNMPYANLFGHVHASPIYRTFSSHHYCVSAERVQYCPVDFERVKSMVQKQASEEAD